ncbi:MAG: hypothetical protein KU28_06195 [Sulfurovum sp. PC08-66]|nr:MAG: hypothetical protein KU28_06195 [Sulfurovum sp. PC08-66]
MQLKRLYIHNYKSFYDTTIELGKFNIVVGENNSGKSNLIDVLEFISIVQLKGYEQAILEKDGYEKIFNYNYNDSEPIIIEIVVVETPFVAKRRFTFNADIQTISTAHYYVYDNNERLLEISAFRRNKILEIEKYKKFKCEIESLELDLYTAFKLAHLNMNLIFSLLSKTYAFNTQTIRNESQKKATKELQKDGVNLGKNLFELRQKSPNDFEIISNSMITTVNEIDGIDVQETFGNYLIGFKETNKIIGMDMVSDGTINLLATMTALHQTEGLLNVLIAFDEPERHLHLKAVNYLLEAFRSNEKQILITTHSTEILKHANIEEIIFVYRDSDGDTQAIRADEIPNLEKKMESLGYERPMTLDELIGCRIVGDFE